MTAALSIASSTPSTEGIFFKWHEQISKCTESSTSICLAVARVIADYTVVKIHTFGREQWMVYFGVDVGEEPKLCMTDFLNFWYGPDPINPAKMNCETHLPPTLRPKSITYDQENAEKPLCLKTLGDLVQNTKKGNRSKYLYPSVALDQNATKAEKFSYWLIMRRSLLANDHPFPKQKNFINHLNKKENIRYENFPAVCDIAIVVLTQFISTGKYYLPQPYKRNGRGSYSICREKVDFGRVSYNLKIGAFSPQGLHIGFSFTGNKNVGVIGVQKFF